MTLLRTVRRKINVFKGAKIVECDELQITLPFQNLFRYKIEIKQRLKVHCSSREFGEVRGHPRQIKGSFHHKGPTDKGAKGPMWLSDAKLRSLKVTLKRQDQRW
jgi:hypothetical protein